MRVTECRDEEKEESVKHFGPPGPPSLLWKEQLYWIKFFRLVKARLRRKSKLESLFAIYKIIKDLSIKLLYNISYIFTNSAPLGRVGHRAAMSVCVSVCLSVPSRNTHFRRSCRPLVEDRVSNIGLG